MTSDSLFMKMMPPDVISHENQLQHLSEPSIFMLDVFRKADHAGQIFIPHRPDQSEYAISKRRPQYMGDRLFRDTDKRFNASSQHRRPAEIVGCGAPTIKNVRRRHQGKIGGGPRPAHSSSYIIVLYCMVFKYLYSAPQQPWANRGAFGSISFKTEDKF